MRHGADRRVRRMTTKSQLIALMYGQLAGAQSLREIEQGMVEPRPSSLSSRRGGSRPVPRSPTPTPSGPAQLFADLFAVMTRDASSGLDAVVREAVHLVDATSIRL